MRKLIAALAAALSFSAAGCADEDQDAGDRDLTSSSIQPGETSERPPSREITGPDLLPFISTGGVTLIDVRREREWKETGMAEHAIGATLQDANFVDQVLAALEGDKSRPVALICRSGNRSASAQKKLKAAGFTQAINVTGGMLDWAKQDLPMQAYAAN